MNVNPYGGLPDKFVKKFRFLAHKVGKADSNKTSMWWDEYLYSMYISGFPCLLDSKTITIIYQTKSMQLKSKKSMQTRAITTVFLVKDWAL